MSEMMLPLCRFCFSVVIAIMKQILSLLVLLVMSVTSVMAQKWVPDTLGDGYQIRYVNQPNDYSGQVRCTIIRKLSPCGGDRGVLYVHGYNDYFFQKEMGDRFVDSCYNFYAVDLRKYGRSILPGQTKFQVRDMREYFADIDSALSQMKRDGIDNIILMGHSTGGLTTAYYMNENPDPDIKVLILNSPFLDWNQSSFQEKFLIPAVTCFGKLFPNIKISQGGSGAYGESLLKQYGGEWNYNTNWKLLHSPDVDTGWIRAIDIAQGILQNDPHIKVPILLMHSDRSVKSGDSKEMYKRADGVLDVYDISRYGRRLGPIVTEVTVQGGLHDLVLSAPNVRNPLYNYIFSWLDRYDPIRHPSK
jgi:alpha-beta hydrolase superfamily lysophospholipase